MDARIDRPESLRALVKECHPDNECPDPARFMAITDTIREARIGHGQR